MATKERANVIEPSPGIGWGSANAHEEIAAVSSRALPFSTLVELLRHRALEQPERRRYTFLSDGEAEEVHLTDAELDRKARAIGALLQRLGISGGRALLLFPPGLDYIAAFFGCLYADVVAVPAYPPDPTRLARTLPRLEAIVADAQPSVALTTTSVLSMKDLAFADAQGLKALRWLATDEVENGAEDKWQPPAVAAESLAFLQYTSGSTSVPKGVMLTHGNLLSNLSVLHESIGGTTANVGVSWLPPYHDMGLIGCILATPYIDATLIMMSPIAFLQRPLRWLQAISRYRGTVTAAPNFAYDLCLRKITAEERATLDLTTLRVAGCAAEPVRRETLDRFAEVFEPCGFRPEAFSPAYGLSEATLMVSNGPEGSPLRFKSARRNALERGHVVEAGAEDMGVRTLVGCGQVLQAVAIVDPETLTRCVPGQVGEIWVLENPSVAHGYWARPEETKETFGAHLADTGEGPFMRTGDLGFLDDGELFVTGRLKDLMILAGDNHYPEDIEPTVEQSHRALRPGCGAAFSVDLGGEEQLVVTQEVDTRQSLDTDEAIRAIRQAVPRVHELPVHAVVLIEHGSIPKTSSGKIQRHACKADFLARTLDVVAEWPAVV